MKNRLAVFGAMLVVLLFPATMTYVFITSSILEDSSAKVFSFFGCPTITKADKGKLNDLSNEVKNLRLDVEKNRVKPIMKKDLPMKKWAKENGKIRHLSYVKKRFGGRIKIAAKKYNVKKEIIAAVIATEWHPDQNTSCKGAVGPMQLMPDTAKLLKVNRNHEFENILGGTKYLSNLIHYYQGDLKLALAAYNAGPGNVNRYKGIPPFKETRDYVKRVKYLFTHQLKEDA